jgi:hypothetical protein
VPLASPHPLVSSTLTRGSEGWRANVDYLVEAVSLKQAIDDVGIPHGQQHSEIPGIYALDFAAAAHQGEEPGFVKVTVGYRAPNFGSTPDAPPDPSPSGGLVQLGARVQPATFTRDVGGNQIVTSHTFSDPERQGLEVQPAEVDGFVATSVLTITRTEIASPHEVAKTYVGRTNNAVFRNEPVDTWLCSAIEGTSEDQGATYTVTYEFEFRPDTWLARVVFIDEKTNRPVEGLTEGVELRTYQIYERANFGGLNL